MPTGFDDFSGKADRDYSDVEEVPTEHALLLQNTMETVSYTHLDVYKRQSPRRNPMSDNRKYYYLKLKENDFDDDSIVLLESMQDGVLYSNILLKLYLKSLKHGGRLQLDEDMPYTCLLYTSRCV